MTTNLEHHKRASDLMPGGVSSPVRAFRGVEGTPLCMTRGEGAHLMDVEGNRYLDLQMAFGPLILGHAHPEVVEAVTAAASRGLAYGTPIEDEVRLAQAITRAHPACDWVRFTTSGTEAVMSAIRVARAATGRDLIVKFEGCYHGHADNVLVKGGSGLATFGESSSRGVPAGTTADTAVLPLDDDEVLDTFFRDHGDRLACAIVEGIPANHGLLTQREGWVKRLAKLTRDHDALLILDEVITGFRLGPGGAAAKYGLKPDLVTFGKIIGGGLPVGAYGGRRDLMDLVAPLGPVYQAGTLAGNPLAMAAGCAQLDVLARENPYPALARRTGEFADALGDLAWDRGVPCRIVDEASMLWILLEATPDSPRRPDVVSSEAVKRFRRFHVKLLEGGAGDAVAGAKVFAPPSAYEVLFMSTAHTQAHLDEALPTFDAAFRAVAEESS